MFFKIGQYIWRIENTVAFRPVMRRIVVFHFHFPRVNTRKMEMKHNDATHNRPEGDRILDAPYVLTDFEEHIKQLMDEKAWADSDRNSITVFKSATITSVVTCLHKEAAL